MSEWFTKSRVGDLPERAAAVHGDRVALSYGDRSWTFRELAFETDRLAAALVGAGVHHGDRVGVWLMNCPEWILLIFALARVGAVLVPLNTRYRSVDIRYSIAQSGCSMVITQQRSGPVEFLAMLMEAVPGLDTSPCPELDLHEFAWLRRVVLIDDDAPPGCTTWRALLAMEDAGRAQFVDRARRVDPDDPVLVAYTSGTTGHPKGVVHGHCCIRNVVDGASRLGVTHRDVILNYLPLFHLYAYGACALTSMITGARQVLMGTFEAEMALDLIERQRITMVHGFDAHYRDLLAAQAAHSRDLSSLRLGTFPAGTASSSPTAERTQVHICPTVSCYGMTELWTFPTLTFLDASAELRSHASGYPMPGYDIRIIDPESGVQQPVSEPGEIRVRGYMVTRGYFNDPAATRSAFDADGYFCTGDRGVWREDGYLQFLGRYKDMLKVGGENVAPAEIEAFLMQLPGVIEVAVVGMADQRLNEVPVAFIRCDSGSTVTLAEVDAHCRNRIAGYKIPRHVHVVDQFPMTPTGKVQKHLLRELANQANTSVATKTQVT